MSEKNITETASADSLKPTPNGSSKAEMMAQAMMAFVGMSKEDLSHFLNDSLAQIGKEADPIADGAAASNKATVAMKEDIDEMFGDNLSEELKVQATTLFEAHVAQRVAFEVAHLQEQFQESLSEAVDEKIEELTSDISKYVAYAADLYMKENELAIDNGLKTEIAENLMGKLKNVFLESYIEIPENKIDVLQVMTDKVSELEDKLNDVLNQNIELQNVLAGSERESVFEAFKTGLTTIQISKFKKLAEGLSYDNLDELKTKLATLNDPTCHVNTLATGIITEDAEPLDSDKEAPAFENTRKKSTSQTNSYLAAMAKHGTSRL